MFNMLTIEPYAEDVISEYGNNTWYKLSDLDLSAVDPNPNKRINLYVPSETDVYFRAVGSDTWEAKANAADVCDITEELATAGNYELTTDTDNVVYCRLNIVDPGTGNYSNGKISVTGNSENCIPTWWHLYERTNDAAGYYYSDINGKKMNIIESVTVDGAPVNGYGMMTRNGNTYEATIPVPSGNWCARVFCDTGFGYCWLDIYND